MHRSPTTAGLLAAAALLLAPPLLAAEPPAPTPAPPEPAPDQPAASPPAPDQPASAGPLSRQHAYSPGENDDSTAAALAELRRAPRGLFELAPVEQPIAAISTALDRLEADTGLRLRLAYTTLFQQASGGAGDRTRASGDLDLMAAWTLVGRGTANTGTLFTSTEYRHQIGWEAPNSLRDDLGTLQRTTGGFDDRGWAFRDLYYGQRLFNDRLRLAFGRSDVSDFVGGHRLQGINNSFSNRAFSADSTTAYPGGHVTAAGASFRPTDWFYLTGGAANAYGRSTISDLPFLDEGKFFGFSEVGFTPAIDGLGRGRYAILFWNMPARDLTNQPSDWGFTVVAEQSLSDRLHIFARYGQGDEGRLTGLKRSAQGGLGYSGLLGSPENLTGLGFGWTEPSGAGRDEKVLECFHRFQISEHTQFSVGIQGIFDPTNAPGDDALAVLTLRFRLAF
jgi:porin